MEKTEIPKFFVPQSTSKENAEVIYDSVRQFVEQSTGDVLSCKRIFSVRYVHDGKKCYNEVGEMDDRQREVVIAIFEGDPSRFHPGLYYVCTANRGVLRGSPMLVGRPTAYITEFSKGK